MLHQLCAVALTLTFALPALSLPTFKRQSASVPQYVLDHAPLLWLDLGEKYFPSDIGAQITHVHPTVNSAPITNPPSPLTLANLDALNGYGNGGSDVYLTSNEGIRALPSWFNGVKPTSGTTPGAIASVIITVPKGAILDAFYFSFYAYNQGNWVFESPALEFGDHVGDWEHTMIRYNATTGAPQSMWFSQHASGEAFTFSSLQKSGSRPYVYVARGTHANYATPGPHDHTIPDFNTPVGPLTDHTSAGTQWDPLANTYMYSYTPASDTFTALTPSSPDPGFLRFIGHWGDPQLPDNTKGQVNVFGQRKYVAGPTGPRDKQLVRTQVCPDDTQGCLVRPVLTP